MGWLRRTARRGIRFCDPSCSCQAAATVHCASRLTQVPLITSRPQRRPCGCEQPQVAWSCAQQAGLSLTASRSPWFGPDRPTASSLVQVCNPPPLASVTSNAPDYEFQTPRIPSRALLVHSAAWGCQRAAARLPCSCRAGCPVSATSNSLPRTQQNATKCGLKRTFCIGAQLAGAREGYVLLQLALAVGLARTAPSIGPSTPVSFPPCRFVFWANARTVDIPGKSGPAGQTPNGIQV
jgi:hypothetical protein